jgi:hypothetical protein
MIIQCNCVSNAAGNTLSAQHQDRIYGKGKRVYTSSDQKSDSAPKTCTVCGKKVNAGKK